ncbi:hypothetical protein X798_06336, partial [Onchocerca flexuosa]
WRNEQFQFDFQKIVLGIVLVCALCVANPNACKNPAWYTRFCLLLQELHPEHLYRTSASPNMNDAAFSTSECTADNTTYRLRIKNRAAIAMLMPAVHLMHHIWNGMAWVTEDISGEEKDVSANRSSLMKLSTIIVSSSNQSSIPISEDSTSGWDSRNDIIL